MFVLAFWGMWVANQYQFFFSEDAIQILICCPLIFKWCYMTNIFSENFLFDSDNASPYFYALHLFNTAFFLETKHCIVFHSLFYRLFLFLQEQSQGKGEKATLRLDCDNSHMYRTTSVSAIPLMDTCIDDDTAPLIFMFGNSSTRLPHIRLHLYSLNLVKSCYWMLFV